jgi:hypothetical protein
MYINIYLLKLLGLYSPTAAFATSRRRYDDGLMNNVSDTIVWATCCGSQRLSRVVNILVPDVSFLPPESLSHVHTSSASIPCTKCTSPPVEQNHHNKEPVRPTNTAHLGMTHFQRSPPVYVFGRERRDVKNLRDGVVVSGTSGPPYKDFGMAFC